MNEIAQPSVTPYLTVDGGLDALAFYQRAFGAELLTHKMDGDGRRVVHAALDLFGTMIMLSDEFPEYDPDSKAPPTIGATTPANRPAPQYRSRTESPGSGASAAMTAWLSVSAAAGCTCQKPSAPTCQMRPAACSAR